MCDEFFDTLLVSNSYDFVALKNITTTASVSDNVLYFYSGVIFFEVGGVVKSVPWRSTSLTIEEINICMLTDAIKKCWDDHNIMSFKDHMGR